MNLADLADLIVDQLDGHHTVGETFAAGDTLWQCSCGLAVDRHNYHRHLADSIVTAVLVSGGARLVDERRPTDTN